MTTPFWASDPSVLLNKKDVFDLWPTPAMTSIEKLNAISRLVIVLSIIGFLVTFSVRYIFIMVMTLLVIFLMQFFKYSHTSEGFKSKVSNTSNGRNILNPDTLQQFLKSEFTPTNKKNPMGNMLLTDIVDTPNKKSAPPSFNPEVSEDISTSTKRMIQNLNPGIKNTNKQLFGDMGEEFEFDKSMWSYYSMPNTKVANDQGAFANFLYGDMPSCRGGSDLACVQDNLRYTLM